MLSDRNRAIIACAGAGKTTGLVELALNLADARSLLTTYTNENVEQIRQCIVERSRYVPANISVGSWFTFLLREGVRPYQNYLVADRRVRSIFYQKKRNFFQRKSDYFTSEGDIYGDKLSEFVFECNKSSNGRVIKRLERMYDYILIDELQDLSGYDLDVVRDLLLSRISVILVGDPRQATYSTNRESKNKKYKKEDVVQWIETRASANEVKVEYRSWSYRCNQMILDIADSLFPHLPRTTSTNTDLTGHDGVFAILPSVAKEYIHTYNPIVLRHNVRTDTLSCNAANIGVTKGRTYDRVLIFPTEPMLSFLKTGLPENAGDKCRLYVAMTRAKYSVAFVVKDPSSLVWLNSILCEKRNSVEVSK